ncbi:hypothetical protein ASE04_25245 [Rhizobium sp. Root708]|nr:hypothetical protein ASE04_25245 [Rhizobium sp. Root708]
MKLSGRNSEGVQYFVHRSVQNLQFMLSDIICARSTWPRGTPGIDCCVPAAFVSGGRITPPLTLQSYATSAVEISLDIGKATRELGYAPVISKEEGLGRTADGSALVAV